MSCRLPIRTAHVRASANGEEIVAGTAQNSYSVQMTCTQHEHSGHIQLRGAMIKWHSSYNMKKTLDQRAHRFTQWESQHALPALVLRLSGACSKWYTQYICSHAPYCAGFAKSCKYASFVFLLKNVNKLVAFVRYSDTCYENTNGENISVILKYTRFCYRSGTPCGNVWFYNTPR